MTQRDKQGSLGRELKSMSTPQTTVPGSRLYLRTRPSQRTPGLNGGDYLRVVVKAQPGGQRLSPSLLYLLGEKVKVTAALPRAH